MILSALNNGGGLSIEDGRESEGKVPEDRWIRVSEVQSAVDAAIEEGVRVIAKGLQNGFMCWSEGVVPAGMEGKEVLVKRVDSHPWKYTFWSGDNEEPPYTHWMEIKEPLLRRPSKRFGTG